MKYQLLLTFESRYNEVNNEEVNELMAKIEEFTKLLTKENNDKGTYLGLHLKIISHTVSCITKRKRGK